jgi:hypothetical protein
MTRRLMILALTIAGCNGGGESTTAAETTPADTGSTGTPEPTTTTAPEETGTPVTSETGTPVTSDTGEPETSESTAADTTAGEETATTTGGCAEVELVGEWLSEGDNVAPLLVNVLNLVSVQALFEDITFEVNSTNTDGAMGQQTGTYSIELCPGSDTKYSIVLEQTTPSAATAEGIFEIDGCLEPAVMRYEVIQTQPDLGSAAPTCDDDFGTGDFGADNIQIFVRQ